MIREPFDCTPEPLDGGMVVAAIAAVCALLALVALGAALVLAL